MRTEQLPHVKAFFRESPVLHTSNNPIQIMIFGFELSNGVSDMGQDELFVFVLLHHVDFQMPKGPFW